MRPTPPPAVVYRPLLLRALEEDLGVAGDLTTDAIVPPDHHSGGGIVARQDGRVAGVTVAAEVFTLLDRRVSAEPLVADGDDVAAGTSLVRLAGPTRAVLTGERTALNLLGRMGGIATVTRNIVHAIRHTRAGVAGTRKTAPGLRALDKYAVRAGGGVDHRFGLDDAVLIKDNHLAVAGSVKEAVERVRARVGHLVRIQLEVDDLGQLEEGLELEVEAFLLDNMTPEQLAVAVDLIDGQAIAEASGGIDARTAPAIAETGVDLLSVGWITHSAPALDVALDL